MTEEKFWTEQPCSLFSNVNLLPTSTMTNDEKLNALTRSILLISAGLFFFNVPNWYLFLIIGIGIVLILKCSSKTEGFSVTPTYLGDNMDQTTLAPTFAEEWQTYPQEYDIRIDDGIEEIESFPVPLKPQSYPYGQLLTRTNLLPSDEYTTHQMGGGSIQAKEYVNGAILRNDLAFRENLSRIHKKKLERRFRHNCGDLFSPYHSS